MLESHKHSRLPLESGEILTQSLESMALMLYVSVAPILYVRIAPILYVKHTVNRFLLAMVAQISCKLNKHRQINILQKESELLPSPPV
jgi:hypothetical protein